jgi:hypothetical protein
MDAGTSMTAGLVAISALAVIGIIFWLWRLADGRGRKIERLLLENKNLANALDGKDEQIKSLSARISDGRDDGGVRIDPNGEITRSD